MIKKILIANRGEVALRIIRTCRELGITSVAVYSKADEDSLHVSLADEAYCIGQASASDSYLNTANIISTALMAGVDAIHPGYGFLSENANFAELCIDHNLIFIGPRPESIRLMGDKASAKKTMKSFNIPIIEGTDIISDIQELKKWVSKVGFPIILKATAGGGGKGMRIVNNEDELEEMFVIAQKEALSNFGNDKIYAEKYIENPKHIEFQIISDNYGNVCHLGERDCSIQRRHQKLLEESPASFLSDKLRREMGEIAIKATKCINYSGVGTVEFLVDNGKFYFMEMNTRLQVEHSVTEVATSVDIVKEQILVADGKTLSFSQNDIHVKGAVMECRINAEDPDKDFMPNPGEIEAYIVPGGFGVRVDTHAYSHYKIPPFYDSMIAKLVCWGKDREECRKRMIRALDEYVILGIKTTIPFQKRILEHKKFISGNFTTKFIEDEMTEVKVRNE